MSVEYVKALQEAARSGKPVVHEQEKPKEKLDPASPSSSDLPYHSAVTEAIQAERAVLADIPAAGDGDALVDVKADKAE